MEAPKEIVEQAIARAHRRALRVTRPFTTDRSRSVAAVRQVLPDPSVSYWLDHVEGTKFRLMESHPMRRRKKPIPAGTVIDVVEWDQDSPNKIYIFTGLLDQVMLALESIIPSLNDAPVTVWGQPIQSASTLTDIHQLLGQDTPYAKYVPLEQDVGGLICVGNFLIVGDHPCGVIELPDAYQYIWSPQQAERYNMELDEESGVYFAKPQ